MYGPIYYIYLMGINSRFTTNLRIVVKSIKHIKKILLCTTIIENIMWFDVVFELNDVFVIANPFPFAFFHSSIDFTIEIVYIITVKVKGIK